MLPNESKLLIRTFHCAGTQSMALAMLCSNPHSGHDGAISDKVLSDRDGPSKANRRDLESGTSASQADPKSPTDHHQTPKSIAIELHIIPLLCEPRGISIGAQNLLPPSTLVGSQPPLHICIGILRSSKPNFKQSHLKSRTHFTQLHLLLSSLDPQMMSK